MIRFLLLAAILFQTYPAPGPGRNGHVTVCAGTVSCWPMTEGSGSVFHDNSGSANNITVATPSSFAWQINSPFPGTTPLFNQTAAPGAVAASATPTNFDGTKPFSVSMWITISSAASFTTIGNLDYSNNFRGWDVDFISGGTNVFSLIFYLINADPGSFISVGTTTNVFHNTSTYQYLITYDGSGSASGVTVYLNGSVTPTSVISSTLSGTAASGLPITFGSRPDGSQLMGGATTWTCIYSTQLNSTQAANLFAQGATTCNP